MFEKWAKLFWKWAKKIIHSDIYLLHVICKQRSKALIGP